MGSRIFILQAFGRGAYCSADLVSTVFLAYPLHPEPGNSLFISQM